MQMFADGMEMLGVVWLTGGAICCLAHLIMARQVFRQLIIQCGLFGGLIVSCLFLALVFLAWPGVFVAMMRRPGR